LPDLWGQELRGHNDIVLVAGHSEDWSRQNSRGEREYPKHIGDCEIKGQYGAYSYVTYFSTDCDASGGASGGATLQSIGKTPPTQIGILVRGSETQEQAVLEKQTGRVDKRPFDEHHWASRNVALQGEFLAAVIRARGEHAN